YGVGSFLKAKLQSISTMVGSQRVRVYQLNYHLSNATRRSILESVTLCSGVTATVDGNGLVICGLEKLPATSFTYQESPPNFTIEHVKSAVDGSVLGRDWRTLMVGDLDGDGTREHIFAQDSGTAYLELTAPGCGVKTFPRSAPWWLGSDSQSRIQSSGDFDNDGRVDVVGKPGTTFAFGKAKCGGTATQLVDDVGMKTTGIQGPVSSGGSIDYDGDGILDIFYDADTPTTIFHSPQNYAQIKASTDPNAWSSWTNANSSTISGPPVPDPDHLFQSMRDINGDGMMDTVFDANPFTTPSVPPETQIAFFNGLGFTNAQVKNLAVGGSS